MTAKDKKILEINDKMIDMSESLEPYAIHLTYLYPAILRNGCIELDENINVDRVFLQDIRATFEPKHFIWKYIKIITD